MKPRIVQITTQRSPLSSAANHTFFHKVFAKVKFINVFAPKLQNQTRLLITQKCIYFFFHFQKKKSV